MTRYTTREATVFHRADDERGEFELGPNEIILDSEYRGANRVVMVIASPLLVCGVNGCSREVESPEDVCWQHDDE